MIVTIPLKREHAGSPFALGTFEISDNCPKCGQPRGEIYGTHSYDGSRRLNVDGWKNDCGHTDHYANVREEGKRVDYKEPVPFNSKYHYK